MKSTIYDRVHDLVVVQARIAGPRSEARVDLIVDTGASHTIIIPDVADELGYSAHDGHSVSSITSPLGREFGYRLRVPRFEALGYEFTDFSVAVHDLGAASGINGLLGWDFLQRFNIDIRPRERRISVELI